MPGTDFIDLSSNKSSPIQNHPINTTLDTTLALTIHLPIISQTILTQGTNVLQLAPRALVFYTPPSSPLEPHPYLSSLNDIPPRKSNPPPPPSLSQSLSQTLLLLTPMDFEPSFPPISLSSRLSAQPEPLMSKEKVLDELSQLYTFSQNVKKAIQNIQHVQNNHIPPTSITSLQMPPPFYFTTITTTTIPPLDHHSHHQVPLFLLINHYGLKVLLIPNLKNIHALIVSLPKHLSTIFKTR
ncbi:hypothetical protein Tco_0344784 [Tanacetum coccineum]